MWNSKNIGLDIDDLKQGKQLLRILRILKINGKYRLSSSKKGFHFNLNVEKHNKKESLLIRYIFGDCYGRWLGDTRRFQLGIKQFDILFDKKKGKTTGKWKKI